MDQNNKTLREEGNTHNFLFDTSAILYLQRLWEASGVSIFTAINELPDVSFFICNEVASELISGPKAFPPTSLGIFLRKILNAESAMTPDYKENKFLVTENGVIKYVVLNKLSAADYAQILLCQNHPELVLVSNDKKLIKSGAQVTQGRVIGIPGLLNRLLALHPNNQRLKVLKDTAVVIFTTKHAFGKK